MVLYPYVIVPGIFTLAVLYKYIKAFLQKNNGIQGFYVLRYICHMKALFIYRQKGVFIYAREKT